MRPRSGWTPLQACSCHMPTVSGSTGRSPDPKEPNGQVAPCPGGLGQGLPREQQGAGTPGKQPLPQHRPPPESLELPGTKRVWARQDRKQLSTPPALLQDSWACGEPWARERHSPVSEEKEGRVCGRAAGHYAGAPRTPTPSLPGPDARGEDAGARSIWLWGTQASGPLPLPSDSCLVEEAQVVPRGSLLGDRAGSPEPVSLPIWRRGAAPSGDTTLRHGPETALRTLRGFVTRGQKMSPDPDLMPLGEPAHQCPSPQEGCPQVRGHQAPPAPLRLAQALLGHLGESSGPSEAATLTSLCPVRGPKRGVGCGSPENEPHPCSALLGSLPAGVDNRPHSVPGTEPPRCFSLALV